MTVDTLTPRQLMILNKLGQHLADLAKTVRSCPQVSGAVAGDCHPVSHSTNPDSS